MTLTASQSVFLVIVVLMAVQRILEVRHSKRNEARILAAGGYEASPGHFRLMQLLHTLWFPAMVAEVLLLERVLHPALFAGCLVLLMAGQALRYAAILGLGERWTVRIMIQPDAPVKQAGVYRFVRHPNYLGVVLEFIAVPLLHTAYLTAVVFSLLNAAVLWVRIRAEEKALREANGSDYDAKFSRLGRFVPGAGSST